MVMQAAGETEARGRWLDLAKGIHLNRTKLAVESKSLFSTWFWNMETMILHGPFFSPHGPFCRSRRT